MRIPPLLGAAVLTPFLVLAVNPFMPPGAARFTLLVLALFVAPGYAVTTWLTARTTAEVTPMERVALTAGTGIAVAALAITFVNVTPWGIRAPAVLATVGAATVAATAGALARGVGTPAPRPRTRDVLEPAWAPRSGVMAVVVVLVLAGGVLLAAPDPGGSSQAPFTSFYVTLEDGRVGPFPKAVSEGADLVVVLHVENHEFEDTRDRFLVADEHDGRTRTLVDEPLPVPAGEHVTRTVRLPTDEPGAHRFVFTLERDGATYRHLVLPVHVTAS